MCYVASFVFCGMHLSFETIVLIDVSLTVKVATLIFISGRGTAISSAKEEKLGFIELISFLGCANVRAFHESPDPHMY